MRLSNHIHRQVTIKPYQNPPSVKFHRWKSAVTLSLAQYSGTIGQYKAKASYFNHLFIEDQMELVIASSSIDDAGIGCWDLQSGAEQLRYKSCASPPHGLACIGGRFLASSQLRQPSSSSGSVHYWSWSKVLD